MGSIKSKTEIVADHEALQRRVGELERGVIISANESEGVETEGSPGGRASRAKWAIPDQPRLNVSSVESLEGKRFHLPGAEIKRYSLHFANDVFEKEFRKDQVTKSFKTVKNAITIGVLVFAGLGLLELWLVPDNITAAFLLRYAFALPLILLSYVAIFYFSHERYFVPGFLISILAAWLATIIMHIIAGFPANVLYTYYLLLLVLFIHGNMGMLFLHTASFSWLLVGSSLIITVINPDVNLTTMNLLHLSFIIVLNLIAMFVSYNHELTIRRYYRANRIVSLQQRSERELQSQLRETQKMEVMGQLAGGIAHEFNNMLQVIINSVDFARKSIHEPQLANEYLGKILRASNRSATLTRQLLAFSRKSPMVSVALNLNGLIERHMKMVARLIGENIELEFRQGGDLGLVKADPGMIEQVILNLCLNARDAMPDGGRLIIETKNHRADQDFCDLYGWKYPGAYTMMSVSDTGMGMSPETREHIFEPFFTTKEVGQGTGLGLAMVHGIVQQHNGVVEALSEAGVGSTFKIYLPRTDSPEPGEEVFLEIESPGGSETILVAEDEEDVLNMLCEALESKGYRVLAAKDGEEAISVFKANADRIDLVILDMVMPKLRGRAVYEMIRGSGSEVTILFSTGYSLDSSDAEFVAGKGLRTIQKPYAPNVLFTAVREILGER